MSVFGEFSAAEKRARPVRETLELARRLMPGLGISRVANITGLDHVGIPVTTVIRPNSRSLSTAQGKGLTLEAAEVSGLMESIEQFCAERIRRPLILATRNELRFSHPLAEVDQLPRNAISSFHDERRLLWIESLDLVTGECPWLPFEMVHLDMTLPLPSGSGCFPLGSNGLASGNHPFEAFLHGICEVVERDAMTLWCHLPEAERELHRLRLDSVDCPVCHHLLALFAAAEIEVVVWDITSELEIPVFFAKIVDSNPKPWRGSIAAGGSGCHPDRRVALQRALTEAAQSRLTAISGSRDDMGPEVFSPTRSPSSPLDGDGSRDFATVSTFSGDTLKDDLDFLLETLTTGGFSHVLTVDLSLPGLELFVTRVVIPGLEGYCDSPGFVPGARVKERLSKGFQEPKS